MANDRMYIRCTGCGESLLIAKHFGGPWYTVETRALSLSNGLDKFFIKHRACAPPSSNFMTCGMHYELKYEMDDDYGDWCSKICRWEDLIDHNDNGDGKDVEAD